MRNRLDHCVDQLYMNQQKRIKKAPLSQGNASGSGNGRTVAQFSEYVSRSRYGSDFGTNDFPLNRPVVLVVYYWIFAIST